MDASHSGLRFAAGPDESGARPRRSPSPVRRGTIRRTSSEWEAMQEALRPPSPQQALVFLAVLVVSLLSPFVDPQVRLCLLLLAVTSNTWYGGLRQGTLAAVLSALVIVGYSLARDHSLAIDPVQGIRLTAFLLACYLLNRFAAAHRRSDQARRRNEDWNRRL